MLAVRAFRINKTWDHLITLLFSICSIYNDILYYNWKQNRFCSNKQTQYSNWHVYVYYMQRIHTQSHFIHIKNTILKTLSLFILKSRSPEFIRWGVLLTAVSDWLCVVRIIIDVCRHKISLFGWLGCIQNMHGNIASRIGSVAKWDGYRIRLGRYTRPTPRRAGPSRAALRHPSGKVECDYFIYKYITGQNYHNVIITSSGIIKTGANFAVMSVRLSFFVVVVDRIECRCFLSSLFSCY